METVVPSHEITRTFKKIEQETIPAELIAEKSDSEIGQLANDPRWLKFQEVIDGMISEWERNVDIKDTDTPSQIGFHYMTARLVSGALKAVRDLPEAIAKGEDNGGQE